jgi:prevent-host-death family protein
MSTVTLQEAQSHLSELIEKLAPGEGVIITKADRPVARLVMVPYTETPRPVLQAQHEKVCACLAVRGLLPGGH